MTVLNTKDVFQLKQELNEFLRENPELRPLQEKITNTLANAGNKHNRMTLLSWMIADNFKQLGRALQELDSIMSRVNNK